MSIGRGLLTAVALVGLALFAACSRPEPQVTPTSIDLKAVLRQSGQVMQSLESFHLSLRHENGSTQFLPGLNIEMAEGDVVTPDMISVSFTGTYRTAFAIKASIVTLGNTSYMTNPLTGEWQTGPTGVSPLGFFSPSEGIASMMSRVREVGLVRDDEGHPGVYRLRGILDAEALSPLLGGAIMEGAVVSLDLTIDVDRLLLVEATFTGRVISSDAEDALRVIEISAFDDAISIEPPL